MPVTPYIGRFAPSPTGRLHKGSLLAALASFLDARANEGKWLVRIEDIDPPREIPGAADHILRQLEDHGLHWDGPVLYQSTRLPAYAETLDQLKRAGLLFSCRCNRTRLRELGGRYDGACRVFSINSNTAIPRQDHSIRIKVPEQTFHTPDDLIQGSSSFDLCKEGDFIIHRRDQLPAYQLATALDDHFQNISRVIRGSDLLDSTPRQIYLLQRLNLKIPEYGHIPVLTNTQGQKFSKQNHAPELKSHRAQSSIIACLMILGMPCLPELQHASIAQLLSWAIEHWQITQIPTQREVTESDKKAGLVTNKHLQL